MTSTTVAITILACITANAFAADTTAGSNLSSEEYSRALSIAQRKIEKRSASALLAQSRGGVNSALSHSPGPPGNAPVRYKVGDTWDVAAWHYGIGANTARFSVAASGIFRYQVTAVDELGRATIEVAELPSSNTRLIDPAVQKVRLQLGAALGASKTYLVAGRRVGVTTDGLKSTASALEAFPLDPPRTDLADSTEAPDLDDFPASVNEGAKKYGVDLAALVGSAHWYSQEDFFGRGIDFVWKDGEPWPTVLRTSGGVAVLIRKGAL